ncbi:hypothetical protein MMC08_005904, partial [Hypocenomyce scalaris]|nr:hypothetical protein [Hypocenomyce scalaris]
MASAGKMLSPSLKRPQRLSSVVATREELLTGPTVVVPPKHIMAPSDAHETALAIEMAKHNLDKL